MSMVTCVSLFVLRMDLGTDSVLVVVRLHWLFLCISVILFGFWWL
jgi:hypothetical protein